jgi:alpha-N-arabinofuranosidase
VQLDTDQVGFTLEGRSEVLPVVAGSASLKGKTLFVTLTNAHAADAAEVTMSLVGGARAEAASARAISGEIHLHNTFDSPERVRPVEQPAAARGSEWKVTLPAASVAAIEVRLS